MLQSLMKSLLNNNEGLRNEYETLNKWLIGKEKKKRKLNVINETRRAIFKKARISLSIVNIDTSATFVYHEQNLGDILTNCFEKSCKKEIYRIKKR